MTKPEQEHEGPVIHDRRRIDPRTGQVKDPAGGGAPGQAAQAAVAGVAKARAAKGSGAKAATATKPDKQADKERVAAEKRVAELEAAISERTADLQRVTAEYANYRKRVDRDREAVKALSTATVLAGLLPVLDDIGRARDHGELEGGFKAVAESLERAVQKFGLESFGSVGEPFDPTVHEALLHSYSADVSEPTCVALVQPGYRIGDRIIRPARVAVAEPQPYDPSGGEVTDEHAENAASADAGEK
jgi:molecular chaperone GrpE